jgi:hypothetical protein
MLVSQAFSLTAPGSVRGLPGARQRQPSRCWRSGICRSTPGRHDVDPDALMELATTTQLGELLAAGAAGGVAVGAWAFLADKRADCLAADAARVRRPALADRGISQRVSHRCQMAPEYLALSRARGTNFY